MKESLFKRRVEIATSLTLLFSVLLTACGVAATSENSTQATPPAEVPTWQYVDPSQVDASNIFEFMGCMGSAAGIEIPILAASNAETGLQMVGSGSSLAKFSVTDVDGVHDKFLYLASNHVIQEAIVEQQNRGNYLPITELTVLSALNKTDPLTKTKLNLENVIPIYDNGVPSIAVLVLNNKNLNGIEPPYVENTGANYLRSWTNYMSELRARSFPSNGIEQYMEISKLDPQIIEQYFDPRYGNIYFLSYLPEMSGIDVGGVLADGSSGVVMCQYQSQSDFDAMVGMLQIRHGNPALHGFNLFTDETIAQIDSVILQYENNQYSLPAEQPSSPDISATWTPGAFILVTPSP